MRAKTYTCIQDVLSNSKDKSKEHAIKYIWEMFSSLTNSCMKFLTWVISWMMLLFGVSCCWRSCANDLNFDNKASSHSLSPDSEMPLSVRDAEFWKIKGNIYLINEYDSINFADTYYKNILFLILYSCTPSF